MFSSTLTGRTRRSLLLALVVAAVAAPLAQANTNTKGRFDQPDGWTKLVTRPDDDGGSIVPFKSGERAKIASAGYTIIATIGDQQSDIDGGFAECGFKLPNPFYFVD